MPNPRKSDPYDYSLEQPLDDRLTGMAFEQGLFPVLMVGITGAVLAGVLSPYVPSDYLFIWLTLLLMTLFVRVWMILKFRRVTQQTVKMSEWRRIFIIVSGLSGTVWGSLALFNFYLDQEVIKMVLVIAILGVAVGGLVSYAAVRYAYAVYLVLAFFQVSIWMMGQGEERHVLLILLVFLGITLFVFGNRYRQSLIDGISMGMSNERLVEDLSHTNKNLGREKVNQEVLRKLVELGLTNDSLKNVMTKAVRLVCQIPWIRLQNKGAIFIANESARKLTLLAPWNLDLPLVEQCANLKYGECLCGKAAQSGKIIFSACVDKHHEIGFDQMADHGHYCVPISHAGKRLGVMMLYLEHGHEKVLEEAMFLQAVANTLAGIIERVNAEESSHIALRVMENTSDAIIVTDPEGLIVSINPAFTTITGYHDYEVIGQRPSIYRSGVHEDSFYEKLWSHLIEHGEWEGEITNRRKNGSLFTVQENISSVRNASGKVINYISVFHDISHIKRAEEDMRQLAYYDALTGLPNRYMFENRLQQQVEIHSQLNQMMAILFVDIYRFRTMNQSFGYSAGDNVLKATVQRLKTVVRNEDTLTRVGGDEFAIILSDVQQLYEVEQVVRRIINIMLQPFKIDGLEVPSKAHIGIAIYPEDANNARDLIDCADTALHEATSQNDDTVFQFYSGEQKQQSVTRLRLESDLRKAVDKQQLVMFYQPQFALVNGELVGAEALLRWNRGGQGLVSPVDFIPLAEQTGLIIPMTEWIIPQVVDDWFSNANPNPVIPRVAINLSAAHFGQPEALIEFIEDLLDKTGVDARHLEIEVTESSILQDMVRATESLKAMRDLGLSIALDDFGTGYSSLSYLVNLPIDILKLDRMFITDIESNSRNLDIVNGLIMMCHSIGIQVIAEGIENQQQARLLQQLECDIGQGFYLGRPVEASQFNAKPDAFI